MANMSKGEILFESSKSENLLLYRGWSNQGC